MKKLLLIACGLIASIGLMAQNDKADNIVGTYAGGSGKDAFKVKITKLQDGTKIYDPNRGIKVSMTAAFDSPKVLKIRGSVLGIGETEVWKRVE